MSEIHYSLEAVIGYLANPDWKSLYSNGMLVRHDMRREIIYYLRELEKNMAVKSSKQIEEAEQEEIVEEIDGTEPVSIVSDEDEESESQRYASGRADGSERRSRRSDRNR